MTSGFMQQNALQFWFSPSGKTAATLKKKKMSHCSNWKGSERLLLNHANTPGFFAPGGEEFNPGPETRLDCSELLCNKVFY